MKSSRRTKIKKKLINLSDITINHFMEALEAKATETVLAGSRKSGKTASVAMFILKEMLQNPTYNVLVVRENAVNIKGSVWEDIKEAGGRYGIAEVMDERKTSPVELRLPAGNRVVFRGLENPSRVKGEKRANQKFMYLVIEEAQNLLDYDVIQKVDDTAFRAQDEGHTIIIMNTDIQNWVYDNYFSKVKFEPDIATLEKHGYITKRYRDEDKGRDWVLQYSTVHGNKYLGKLDWRKIKQLKHNNYQAYLVEYCAQWGNLRGAIYPNWDKLMLFEDIRPDTDGVELKDHTFGIDYGEKDGATVCLHAAFSLDYSKMYLLDMRYWKNSENTHQKNAIDFEDDIYDFINYQVQKWKPNYFVGVVDSAAEVFRMNLLTRLEKEGYKKFSMLRTHNLNENPGKVDILQRIQLDLTLMAEGRMVVNTNGNFEAHFRERRRAIWDENSLKPKRKDVWNDTLDTLEYIQQNRRSYLMTSGKEKFMRRKK